MVPFFLLLTRATHSLQLPHRPSHTSGFPSMRRVSCGSWKGCPVAAEIPWVKLLSYCYSKYVSSLAFLERGFLRDKIENRHTQNALFFNTSHRPGLQIPHHPSLLFPCPRTHLGVYKSPSNRNSCSWGIRSGSDGFISSGGGANCSS